MTERFQNKYRISSARLKTWDYSNNAAYFITVCTQNREHYFGEIRDGKMQLSSIGKIVETEWIKTPAIRPDMNLELGEFVVMPNHFHAILIIGENEFNTREQRLGGKADGDRLRVRANSFDDINAGIINNSMRNIETGHVRTLVPPTLATTYTTKNKFGPQTKNLASIIRGFKSAVTTQVKKMSADVMQNIDTNFAWQPRYHDHVIRDTASFVRIQKYIVNNPAMWKEDKFFPVRI